jgi:flagellar basal body-associated protein FliL
MKILIIVGVVFIVLGLMVYSWLVSAGRADERMEEIHNREIINKNGIA